jgi:hypothetical protein
MNVSEGVFHSVFKTKGEAIQNIASQNVRECIIWRQTYNNSMWRTCNN